MSSTKNPGYEGVVSKPIMQDPNQTETRGRKTVQIIDKPFEIPPMERRRTSVAVRKPPPQPQPQRRPSCPAQLPHRRTSRSSLSRPWAQEKPPKEPEKPPPAPNTFQLEPYVKFPVDAATATIKTTVDEALADQTYDPATCKRLCGRLADEVKAKVRRLPLDERYKIVVVCAIGDKSTQGIRVASRCAWDHERDNFASYSYDNKSLFATVTVYAVYFY